MCFPQLGLHVDVREEEHHWWSHVDEDAKWEDQETFKLAVGETAVVRDDYVERLNKARTYKVMFTRSSPGLYVWLDNHGASGTVTNGDEFFGAYGSEMEFSIVAWKKLGE